MTSSLPVWYLQAREQLRGHAARIEAMALQLRQRDDSMAVLQAQLESAQSTAAARQRQLDEERDMLQKESSKRQRIEDESKVCVGDVTC